MTNDAGKAVGVGKEQSDLVNRIGTLVETVKIPFERVRNYPSKPCVEDNVLCHVVDIHRTAVRSDELVVVLSHEQIVRRG